MKVSPLIAPPEGFEAAPMTYVQRTFDAWSATAWTVFYVDGEQIEHRHWRRTAGIAHVRPDSAPVNAGDADLWAMREAIRKTRARDNRYAAYIVNRYRRGRILVTKEEMTKWRQYHQRAFQRRKKAATGDLVDVAAAGDLRPIMGPTEYVECMRDGGE